MARVNRALTDRARVLRQVATAAERVEGMTPTTTVGGEWVPCRLVPGQSRETQEAGGRRAVIARAELVIADEIDAQASDKIEVRSRLLGDSVWNIVGAPQRATTTRAMRAVVLPLEQTIEPTVETPFA